MQNKGGVLSAPPLETPETIVPPPGATVPYPYTHIFQCLLDLPPLKPNNGSSASEGMAPSHET